MVRMHELQWGSSNWRKIYCGFERKGVVQEGDWWRRWFCSNAFWWRERRNEKVGGYIYVVKGKANNERNRERERESHYETRGRLKPWFHTVEVALVLKDQKKQKRRRKAHSKYAQIFVRDLGGMLALFNLLCFVSYSFVRTSSCRNREKDES